MKKEPRTHVLYCTVLYRIRSDKLFLQFLCCLVDEKIKLKI
jgi:hypothetical protein